MGSVKVRKAVINATVSEDSTRLNKMSPMNVELGRVVGQGSYAKVYSAKHKPTGNSVAVKVIDTTKSYAMRSVTTYVSFDLFFDLSGK